MVLGEGASFGDGAEFINMAASHYNLGPLQSQERGRFSKSEHRREDG